MKISRGFVWLPVLIGILAVLTASGGAWWYVQQRAPASQIDDISSVSQQSAASSTTQTKTTVSATDQPRFITCNPHAYDPSYFESEKPCVSDMTSSDTDREERAIAIFQAVASTAQLTYWKTLGHFLLISDKRYPVLFFNVAPKTGYVVVDLDEGKISDSFVTGTYYGVLERTSRYIRFLNAILSSDNNTIGERVYQYAFGTPKAVSPGSSVVYWPQTYVKEEGGEGSTFIPVLASTTDSISLGVYDRNKSSRPSGTEGPTYEQVGSKTIIFTQ